MDFTAEDLKKFFEGNPKLKGESSKKLVRRLGVRVEEIQKLRAQLSGRTSRYIELAEENGIKASEISGGWLKQKGEPSINFSLRFNKEKEEEKKFKEEFEEFLKEYKSDYKPLKRQELNINYNKEEPNILVISLADFHLDKQDYLKEVDLEERLNGYLECLNSILVRSFGQAKINKILFIAGNDFFNADNYQGQTTHLTPQDNCISWDKAYEKGFDLLVKAINRLKEFCEHLDIVLTNGNHSYTKEFYLLHALEMYFREDKNIKFDKSPKERKVYTYGQMFFGLTHGNTKMQKLPLTFATEFFKEWGQCKFKEILLGDKHTDRSTSFITKDEFNGVNVRIVPSLTGADHWHYENQFTGNIQRGLGIIYSSTKGKQAEIYYNL